MFEQRPDMLPIITPPGRSIRRFLRIVTGLLLPGILALSPCFASTDQEAALQQSFSQLQHAMAAKDVDGSIALLSAETQEYYRLLARIILRSDKKELANLSAMNRMMVETTSRLIPKKTLKQPSALLKTAIARGMGGAEMLNEITLSNFEVNGDRATAQIAKKGRMLPLKMAFTRENGSWKVNLISLLEQTNALAEALMAKFKMRKEDYLKLSAFHPAPRTDPASAKPPVVERAKAPVAEASGTETSPQKSAEQ